MRRISSSSELGDNDVADVPAFAFQNAVERVTNGHPPDDARPNKREEKRFGNIATGQVRTLSHRGENL